MVRFSKLAEGLRAAVASVGGIGFLPRGGASAGTLAGATVFMAIRPGVRLRIAMVLGAMFLGHLVAIRYTTPHQPDPEFIVIDELAGVWLALLAVPSDVPNCLLGAVIFRLLDRFKPGPIGRADRAPGAFSVMGDDLLAGAAAGLILRTGAVVFGRTN